MITSHKPRILSALLTTLVLLNLPATAEESAGDDISAERLKRVDQVMGEYVSAGKLPGVVYAAARAGHKPRIGVVGPYQEDSIFRIYSMSKPITVVAVLMLFEEGRFLLGDPVARFLPEFAELSVLGVDGQRRPSEQVMTIKHLLTHTAGLAYEGYETPLSQLYSDAELWASPDLDEFVRRAASLPLAFEPGEQWGYSIAMDVLGVLVERASGQPLDDFVKQRIFDPLGMVDTGFYVPPSKKNRFLPLFSRQGNGMKLTDPVAGSAYLAPETVPFGGSGLVSTVDDYLRFTQMLLGQGQLDGERLLAPSTVELMLMDHLPASWGKEKLPEAWIARTENRNGSLDLGLGFGFGGYVITDVAANSVPGSAGTYAWGGAASTYFFVDPQSQLGGVFLTQLWPSDSYPLRAQFRALVYQSDMRSVGLSGNSARP